MPIRLLNTRSLAFESFNTYDFSQVPRYAILSHVWDGTDGEATYATFKAALSNGVALGSIEDSGFKKIVNFCKQAAADGFEYGWVDTCCIDKKSEPELLESINSMFLWYKNSGLCYTYLLDVPSTDKPLSDLSAFRKSKWFTRGWTLQELIAPKSLVFYSQDWEYLGTKADLSQPISEVTGIGADVLSTGDTSMCSVGMKLSWGASRQTTYVEDRAYCLVGFFNLFMPVIYGERENAFRRLLEAILQEDNDQTLFSWTGDGSPCGMLAPSPSNYLPLLDASDVYSSLRNPAFRTTNRGVHIELPLIPLPVRGVYAMVLNCLLRAENHNGDGFLVQFVYRQYDDHNDYIRIYSDRPVFLPKSLRLAPGFVPEPTEVYVNHPRRRNFAMNRKVTFRLQKSPSCVFGSQETVFDEEDQAYRVNTEHKENGKYQNTSFPLDDRNPSTVLLFKNAEGHQISVCLMLWGKDVKAGIAVNAHNEELSRVADAFLFGKKKMVLKQPGTFSLKASRRGVKPATLQLEDCESLDKADEAVCHVRLDAPGYWLHKVGPGLSPGCWTRYFAYAEAKPKKRWLGILDYWVTFMKYLTGVRPWNW